MLDTASLDHKFKLSVFQPTDPKNFIKFLRKEIQLLRSSLPLGIHVKSFEDRMVIIIALNNPYNCFTSIHFLFLNLH